MPISDPLALAAAGTTGGTRRRCESGGRRRDDAGLAGPEDIAVVRVTAGCAPESAPALTSVPRWRRRWRPEYGCSAACDRARERSETAAYVMTDRPTH